MDALRDEIKVLRCQNIERRHFIPQEALYAILGLENIRTVLKDQGIEKEQLEELAQNITHGKRPIFGILVCIRKFRSILKFVKIDHFQYQPSHLDHKLPFEKEDLGKLLPPPLQRSFMSSNGSSSPVSSKSTLPRYLEDDTVLPFLQEEVIGQGGFGVVYKVLLHETQQHFFDTPGRTVWIQVQDTQLDTDADFPN